MLDNLMVSCAGASAERQLLGEHTSGSETDFDSAVSTSFRMIKAGFGGPGMFVGEDGLPYGSLALRRYVLGHSANSIQETRSPRRRPGADEVIAKHEDALIIVATAVYEHRRLSDERLKAVLESAGFALPRPTA